MIKRVLEYVNRTSFHYLRYGFFIFIALYRFSFIGKGAVSMPDEFRYWHGFHGFYQLAQGHFVSAMDYFFTLGGRPFLSLAFLPEYCIQAILYIFFDLDPRSTNSLISVQCMFVINSILLLLVFYLVLRKIFRVDQVTALIFTILFSAIHDTNIYIRHLYVYDLIIALWLMYWLWFEKNKNFFIAGMIFISLIFVYPAYWTLGLIVLAIAFIQNSEQNKIFEIKQLIRFGLGVILVIILILGIGLLSGHLIFEDIKDAGLAYLYDLKLVYDGSIIVLWKYYLNLDHQYGVFVFLISLLGIHLSIFKWILKREMTHFTVISLGLVFSIILNDVIGQFYDQKMLYARMCKQYSPMLILMILPVYNKLNGKYKNGFVIAFCVLAFYNLFLLHVDFYPIQYPRDVLAKSFNTGKAGFEHDLLISKEKDQKRFCNQYESNLAYSVPPQSKNILGINNSCVFENFAYYSSDYLKQNTECERKDLETIYSCRHFLSYPVYTFDIMNKVQNDSLIKNLYLKILKQK